MELIQTFEEYKQERYLPLELEFLNKTSEHLSKNFLAVRKYCIEEWQKALTDAITVQQETGDICNYISVSLLNTSVMENSPCLQIDFYNEEWVYGESWSRSRMNADFLFKHWQDFKISALDDRFYQRSSFGLVEIESLFYETADKLAFMFACFAKYFAYQIEYSDKFDDLAKAENFYMTCGVYLDWQNRIFAQLPEIDLVNPAANEDTNFRSYRKKILRGESFRNIDLRGCYFEDCLFQNFEMTDVSLVDARFLRCRFVSVNFENVKTAGSNFSECYFKDCIFKNCTANSADADENEYFAKMRLYHCYMFNSENIDCDFERLELIDYYSKE